VVTPVSPVVGYNNNVRHRGRILHIQTEDSGVKHPHIITHLFVDGGRIIHSVKTSYAEHLGSADLSERVRVMMKDQHKRMFLALREGTYDVQVESAAPANSRPSTREAAAPIAPIADRVSGEIARGQMQSLQPTEPLAAHVLAPETASATTPAITDDLNVPDALAATTATGKDVTLPPARKVSSRPDHKLSQPLVSDGRAEQLDGTSTSEINMVHSAPMSTLTATHTLSLSLRQTELAGVFRSEVPAGSAGGGDAAGTANAAVITASNVAADVQPAGKPVARAARVRVANLFAEPPPNCIAQAAEQASLELLRYLLSPIRDGR
jgi:hypothetical protein